MNSKLEKFTDERNKIIARMAILEERRKVLDGKIMEAENLEIRAMMRSENLSLHGHSVQHKGTQCYQWKGLLC